MRPNHIFGMMNLEKHILTDIKSKIVLSIYAQYDV